MGHLVCIGQWAAFIMVDHAFLGRGRRFRFPCLWAALLAAAFLAASIRHDIGFFNVESVILNVIYLLVTMLFFGGSWNQKLSACLVNGIMCLLTENTVSYTFAWCKHIPVREVWRYRSCLFLLVAAVVGAGLLAAYIIRRWRREQALTPLQMLVMSFFPGIVVALNIVLMVSGGSEVPSMMNMMLTFGLTIAVLIHLGIVQMVNDQMLLQQTLMVEAVRQTGAKLVGLSALMTTTVPNMQATIEALHAAGLDCKVMVGGAVLTPDYARNIGADYYCKDAKASADLAKQLLG